MIDRAGLYRWGLMCIVPQLFNHTSKQKIEITILSFQDWDMNSSLHLFGLQVGPSLGCQ